MENNCSEIGHVEGMNNERIFVGSQMCEVGEVEASFGLQEHSKKGKAGEDRFGALKNFCYYIFLSCHICLTNNNYFKTCQSSVTQHQSQ